MVTPYFLSLVLVFSMGVISRKNLAGTICVEKTYVGKYQVSTGPPNKRGVLIPIHTSNLIFGLFVLVLQNPEVVP